MTLPHQDVLRRSCPNLCRLRKRNQLHSQIRRRKSRQSRHSRYSSRSMSSMSWRTDFPNEKNCIKLVRKIESSLVSVSLFAKQKQNESFAIYVALGRFSQATCAFQCRHTFIENKSKAIVATTARCTVNFEAVSDWLLCHCAMAQAPLWRTHAGAPLWYMIHLEI